MYSNVPPKKLFAAAMLLGLGACGYPALPKISIDEGDAGQDANNVDAPGGGSTSMSSCKNLPATCGADAYDDCCRSIYVPGGLYYRSFDVAGDPNSGNQNFPASVNMFRLDKYEVTVGRFRAFVAAGQGIQSSAPSPGAGAHANITLSGWDSSWNASLVAVQAELLVGLKCDATFQTWTDAPGANEARPMNCVTWYEAMAFCAWDGGYLPTEAEWNFVAAGGSQHRAYPWSDPSSSLNLDSSRSSYYDGTNCVGDGLPGCTLNDLVRVGSKSAGDGRWGHSDLLGNVAEWILDWYGEPYPVPCDNCAQVSNGSRRAVRSSSAAGFVTRLSVRNTAIPSERQFTIGIRCARPQ